MVAAILDIIVDEVPLSLVEGIATDAETARGFFAAVQAQVETQDILKDHKERLNQNV